MGKVNIEFPCGYKIKVSWIPLFECAENINGLTECPIHGNKCKKK